MGVRRGGEHEAGGVGLHGRAEAAAVSRLGLVEVGESVPSLLAPLDTDERIARLIAGEDYPNPRVQYLLAPVPAAPCPIKHRPAAMALADGVRQANQPSALIVGPRGSARAALAQTVASHPGLGASHIQLPLVPDRALAPPAAP